MKKRTQFISVLLCIVMVLGLLPVQAFAATVVASGYCGGEGDGTNLRWTLDSDGVLTISGSGTMADYTYSSAPWDSYKTSMTKLVIGVGVSSIGNYSFCGCSSFTGNLAIPNSVTSIGDYAFSRCSGFTGDLNIPDSVTIIGSASFADCSGFTGGLSIGKSVVSIGRNAFDSCNFTGSLIIPDSVLEIKYGAFSRCNFSGSLLIGNNVTMIDSSAFSCCDGFTGSLTIPDKVTFIGNWAFANCSGFNGAITLGNNVQTIGKCAFSFCYNLSGSLSIPKSVSSISAGAFEYLMGIDEILVEAGNPQYVSIEGVLYNKTVTKLVQCPAGKKEIFSIPNSVIEIGDSAFVGCYDFALEDIDPTLELPSGLLTIGDDAFYSSGYGGTLTIPDTVKTIGKYAFSGCSDFDGPIFVGRNVVSIGEWAFINSSVSEAFFLGNAPAVTANEYGASFDNDVTLYYISGMTGWTDSSAYDAAAGTWNGYKLETWDGPTFTVQAPPEDETPTVSGSAPYYATTESRLFRVHAAGSAYPSPAGFDIQVGSAHYTSGLSSCSSTDDITAQIPSDYSGSIVISKSGFHTYTMPEQLAGQYNTVQMMPDSVTAPFAQTLLSDHSTNAYRSYRNLLFGDSESVYELSIDDEAEKQRMYASVNWNGHGAGIVWLEQGETKIILNNDGFTDVCLAEHFSANETIYLCARAADGAETKVKTSITILKRTEVTIPADFGDSFDISTESSQEEMHVLEKNKLKIDFSEVLKEIPIEVEIKEDGTIKGTIGIKLQKASYTESAFGSIKEAFSRLSTTNEDEAESNAEIGKLIKDINSQYGYVLERHSTFGVSGNIQVVGYFTGNVLDGRLGITELELALVINGSVSYTHNTTLMGVPAYFKVALKNKLSQSIKMVYDKDLEYMVSAGKQPLTITFTLTAECGPGWEGYLSCGVQGSGEVKVYTITPVVKNSTSATLKGAINVVGTLCGVKGSWSLVTGHEYVFWENGALTWHEKADANALAFTPDTTRQVMLFSTLASDSGTIASNVSGYDAACLLALSDGSLLAVWAADVPGRSATDSTGLYFSIYKEDAWSTPALVWDDGTTDFAPTLQQIGGQIWLVWQNYTKAYHQSSFDNLSLDEISANCDIAAARFNETSGAFEASANISCEGYDYAPQISMQNGVVTAAWMNGEQQYTASLVDSTWTAAVQGEAAWYQTEQAMPSTWEDDAPVSNCNCQVFSATDYQAIVYTAADANGRNQVYGLFNDGYGWGEAIQLTDVTDGSIGSFQCVLNSDYQISILATECVMDENGAYQSANLMLFEKDLNTDLTVNSADYVRDTYVAGQTLTIKADVTNNSGTTVSGVMITAANGTTELATNEFGITLLPGQTKTAYLNYQLPMDFDLDSICISVQPKEFDDIDISDNLAVCVFQQIDISVEKVSAVQNEAGTQILTQIVNRGMNACSSFQVTFRSGTLEGEILGTQTVSGLQPGELANIFLALTTKMAAGEMVYVEAEQLSGENLYGNNSNQATVTVASGRELNVSVDAGYADGTLSLSAAVTNYAQAPMDVIILAATYDSSGKLISSAVSDRLTVDVLQSEGATLKIMAKEEPASWKVFMLDAETMHPICDCING